MFDAPRTLKEPVSCRFSAFRSTRAPTRRDSSPAPSNGVCRTTLEPLRSACSTSANDTASSIAAAAAARVSSPAATKVLAPERDDRVDLHSRSLRKRGHADRGSGRRIGLEELAVGLVHL